MGKTSADFLEGQPFNQLESHLLFQEDIGGDRFEVLEDISDLISPALFSQEELVLIDALVAHNEVSFESKYLGQPKPIFLVADVRNVGLLETVESLF
jgi:hypothetical protein